MKPLSMMSWIKRLKCSQLASITSSSFCSSGVRLLVLSRIALVYSLIAFMGTRMSLTTATSEVSFSLLIISSRDKICFSEKSVTMTTIAIELS